jgi:hypothetical protein
VAAVPVLGQQPGVLVEERVQVLGRVPAAGLVELPLAAAAIWLAVALTRGTGRQLGQHG